MSEVMPRDILLRVGGRTLQRYGVLAVAGAGRSVVEVKETFTRASTLAFRDRDGIGRKAAADKVAIEYPGELSGLVDAFGNPYCGPRLNGARTQLVTDPENFGNWANLGTPVKTGGQADPFGGLAAYTIADDSAAASEGISQTVTFTADATKGIALFIKKHTPPATKGYIALQGNGGVWRGLWSLTWAADVPVLTKEQGDAASVAYTPEAWGAGWYRVSFSVAGVLATDTNSFVIYPANPNNVSETGTLYTFGANAWNAPFPSSYQGPSGGASPSVTDSLTVPFNWGSSRNVSALVRVLRPAHLDVGASVDIGIYPGLFSLGNAISPWIRGHYRNNSRDITASLQSAASPQEASLANLAGVEQKYAFHFKNLVAGGQARLDVGGGYGSFSGVAGALPKFGSQILRVGFDPDPLFSVLFDLILFGGDFTLNEMLAVP